MLGRIIGVGCIFAKARN